jgi:alpha-methylacyl-CoA racemase
MHAVIAILAALVRRGATGQGEYLDVSAADGVLSLMSLSLDQYLATGEVAASRQTLLTGRYACYDVYPCSDDRWISVGAIEPHFYANLCRLLDLEHFASKQHDDEAQDEIRRAFSERFLTKTRDAWVELLAPADTCVAPVRTIPEVTGDPHFRARGSFIDAIHPQEGSFEQTAAVLAGGRRDMPPHHVRPAEETDTDDLLAGAGLAPDEIEKLREEGCVE